MRGYLKSSRRLLWSYKLLLRLGLSKEHQLECVRFMFCPSMAESQRASQGCLCWQANFKTGLDTHLGRKNILATRTQHSPTLFEKKEARWIEEAFLFLRRRDSVSLQRIQTKNKLQ
eukprot:scaffold165936_cov21-Tisochrysis_lutea.AAC.1